MVDAILNDRHMILPCAAYLGGQFGVDGLYVGVPVRLGRSGIEEIVTIELTADEQAAFDASAAAVRDLVTRMAELAAAAPAGATDRLTPDARHHHLPAVRGRRGAHR